MASTAEIAHRWANQKFGKYGSLVAGNTSCDENTFYSYFTPYAQWLDKKRKIMVIMDGAETRSSGKHLHHIRAAIPGGVIVFATSKWGYHGYNDVEFLDWRGEFSNPLGVTETYIDKQFRVFEGLLKYSGGTVDTSLRHYHEAVRFAKYFPKGSVDQWCRAKRKTLKELKGCARFNASSEIQTINRKIRMITAIKKDLGFSEILDYIFGKGEWDKYLKRSKGARERMANTKLAHKIARHIDLGWSNDGMTNSQVLALTPLERVNIKLGKFYSESPANLRKRKDNAYKRRLSYLGISRGLNYYDDSRVSKVTDDTNRVLYEYNSLYYLHGVSQSYLDMPNNWREMFDKNPAHFRKLFWRYAEYMQKLGVGVMIYRSQGIRDPEELEAKGRHEDAVCLRMVLTRMTRYERRQRLLQEKLRRAEEERQREAERNRKYIEQLRTMGDEGFRIIWRKHLGAIPINPDREFFYGGNALLRLSKNGEAIETSKSIKLSIKQAEDMWRLISIWHEDPSKFRKVNIPTLHTTWHADNYVDDILIAGCHRIAYKEMKDMASQLGFIKETGHSNAV